MKKTTRNILIMLAVLVVLGGAAAWLLLMPTEKEETSSSSEAPAPSAVSETVMDREKEEVASISVENCQGNFVIVPNGEDFAIQGYEDSDVNTSSLTYSADSLLTMTAIKNLGSQDDLESFGLADRDVVSARDVVSVEIKYKDGTADRLILGNKAAETSGRYVLKDDTVYIVNGVSELLYGSMYGYFNTDLYTIEDRTEETTDDEGNASTETLDDILYSVKLSGSHFPEPIEIGYTTGKISSYLITSPILADSGSDDFTAIIEALKAPTANSVAAVGLTEEILEEYGLSEPYAKIEFDLNNARHTMTVSKADAEGSCYLLLDDRDTVYQVSKDTVSAWADTSLMDLRMSYIWIANIMDVSGLTLTAEGDMVYSFDVTRKKNEEKSTEDNTSYDLTISSAGGENIDYSKCYQPFYKKLIGLTVVTTDKVEYSGDPVFRIEYSYFEGGEDDVVEFFAAGQDRYAAVVNGTFNGMVRKADLDKVTALLPDLNANKDLSE